MPDAPESSVSPVEGAAAALGVPLTVLRDSVADGRAAYGSGLVLAGPTSTSPGPGTTLRRTWTG